LLVGKEKEKKNKTYQRLETQVRLEHQLSLLFPPLSLLLEVVPLLCCRWHCRAMVVVEIDD
jgi:hypothetical protein